MSFFSVFIVCRQIVKGHYNGGSRVGKNAHLNLLSSLSLFFEASLVFLQSVSIEWGRSSHKVLSNGHLHPSHHCNLFFFLLHGYGAE